MLQALNLKDENAIMEDEDALHSGALFSEQKRHFLILSDSESILSHLDMQPYHWASVGRNKFLKAPSFPRILEDTESKKMLWTALKKELLT